MATLDRQSSDLHEENKALGRLVDTLVPDVSVASIGCGLTVPMEAFRKYLGSGYRQKLID